MNSPPDNDLTHMPAWKATLFIVLLGTAAWLLTGGYGQLLEWWRGL